MPYTQPIVISDDDDDDDNDSQSASQSASASERVPPPKAKPHASPSPPAADPSAAATHTAPVAPSTSLLTSLDRVQMERDRQQRNRKRRRAQGLDLSSDDHQPQPKSSKLASSTPPQPPQQPATRRVSSSDIIRAEDRFWDGTVKLSYNNYVPASKAGCTVASMLLPATPSASRGLKTALLATYDLRMDWLYAHFPRDVDVTLVLNPPKEDHRSDPNATLPGLHPTTAFPAFARFPGWTICVPRKPKGGWLTQHIKFLLLEHNDFLRVAILSGNLNGFDWQANENTAFLQDFPLSTAAETVARSAARDQTNDFEDQLGRVLRSLGLPASHAIRNVMRRADFSKAKARIVASWPEAGVLNGWPAIETQGLGRLGKVVRDLGLPFEKGGVVLEAQGSSLATYDRKWLEQFHLLASGVRPQGLLPLAGTPNDVHPPYLAATQRTAKANAEQRQRDGFETNDLPPVKILFPTQRYVEHVAVLGPPGAGTFFGKPQEFARGAYKALFHQPRSARGDVMMHAKSLLALLPSARQTIDDVFSAPASSKGVSGRRLVNSVGLVAAAAAEEGSSTGERPIGWSYMGSANFTKAAHGNIGGKMDKVTMSTSNWELGVVLPIYKSEVERDGLDCMALRAITYRRPVEAYGGEDGPWDVATLDDEAAGARR